jgi:hypothetical protein
MNREIIISTHFAGHGHFATDYLRQEIAFFEGRLIEMGESGDCAYEHALSKAYRALLKQRKSQLAALS